MVKCYIVSQGKMHLLFEFIDRALLKTPRWQVSHWLLSVQCMWSHSNEHSLSGCLSTETNATIQCGQYRGATNGHFTSLWTLEFRSIAVTSRKWHWEQLQCKQQHIDVQFNEEFRSLKQKRDPVWKMLENLHRYDARLAANLECDNRSHEGKILVHSWMLSIRSWGDKAAGDEMLLFMEFPLSKLQAELALSLLTWESLR